MKQKRVVRIGLDFDGVVTYNPMRIARLVVSFFKHKVLKIRKLGFFVPKNEWQKWFYRMGIVWPSFCPARGTRLLKILAKSSKYQFYLLSGRYGFTKNETYRWLKKYRLADEFKTIFMNENNEQPHRFKEKIIKREKFDYFIEDNLDIVRDLNNKSIKTEVYWIYNILDGWRDYQEKFPYLEKALEKIVSNENTS